MKDLKTVLESRINESLGRAKFTFHEVFLSDEYDKSDVEDWKNMGLYVTYKNVDGEFAAEFKCYTISAIYFGAKLAAESCGENGYKLDWDFLEDNWPGVYKAAKVNQNYVYTFEEVDLGDYIEPEDENMLNKKGVFVKYNFGDEYKQGHLTCNLMCTSRKAVEAAAEIASQTAGEEETNWEFLFDTYPGLKAFMK